LRNAAEKLIDLQYFVLLDKYKLYFNSIIASCCKQDLENDNNQGINLNKIKHIIYSYLYLDNIEIIKTSLSNMQDSMKEISQSMKTRYKAKTVVKRDKLEDIDYNQLDKEYSEKEDKIKVNYILFKFY
jgi:hypothetical protein